MGLTGTICRKPPKNHSSPKGGGLERNVVVKLFTNNQNGQRLATIAHYELKRTTVCIIMCFYTCMWDIGATHINARHKTRHFPPNVTLPLNIG